MGYVTDYRLIDVDGPKEVVDAFREDYADDRIVIKSYGEPLTDVLSFDGHWADSVKWYDCPEDMAEISRQYPNTTFTIECIGEDGDHWRVYARNGRSERAEAIISYPETTLDSVLNEADFPKRLSNELRQRREQLLAELAEVEKELNSDS